MRILFLSDNFPPEGNAPAIRVYEHAAGWVRAGHEVTVITCAPNFPEGRLFAGYKNRWYFVERMSGIRVVRVKTYIAANRGFAKRTLDYMSFMVSGFAAGMFQSRPDVVIGTSPQFFCVVGACSLALLRFRPFVFELRDLWPASIVAVGAMKRSWIVGALEKLELFLYRRARVIVAVTRAFKTDLTERGINPDKICIVRNGVDLDLFHPIPRDLELEERYELRGKFVVGYLGTHGLAHGLDKVLEAVELLQHRGEIVFLFAGGGAARAMLVEGVSGKALSNIRLVPTQPRELMPRLWSLCDLSIVPLRNRPIFSTVIPSKLFESIAMGVPVITAIPEGEATGIVRETGTGVAVQTENPHALASEIERLHDDPESLARLRSACASAAPGFSRDQQADTMLEILRQISMKDGKTASGA